MSYCFTRTFEGEAFDALVERTVAALKQEGFGVLTRIDVQATMKEKLGAEMKPYLILGACNPSLAHAALQAEPDIGVMLPCNVVARETDSGAVQIAAVDPVASMSAVENPALGDIAGDVRARLQRVVAAL